MISPSFAGLVDYEVSSSDDDEQNENHDYNCVSGTLANIKLSNNDVLDLTVPMQINSAGNPCIEDECGSMLTEDEGNILFGGGSSDNSLVKIRVVCTSTSETVPRSTPKTLGDAKPPVYKKQKLDEKSETPQFELPNPIQSMFQDNQHRWEDKPGEHDQRVRSFLHVEGNWATHVYIPVPWDERFFEFVNRCVEVLSPFPFHTMPEFHVSLSRTVVIRHHWIESLVDSLRDSFRHLKNSLSDFSSLKLFTNDEKTRTFLCLELTTEDCYFLDYVKAVDKSLAEFKLPAYYENPSFHVSVGWCLGDVTTHVSEEKITHLKEMFGGFMASNPDLSVLNITQICCRTGNKSFLIPLKDSHR